MVDLKHIAKFIDERDVSFVSSVDEDGFPNMKAMLKPRKREGLHTFYFTTNTSSMRVRQYQNNEKASIYFYHKGAIKYIGVMFIGTMEVLTDQESKNMIWKKGDTMYYKGGVTDPDYCVLKFTAKSGRYYCNLTTESFEIEREEKITLCGDDCMQCPRYLAKSEEELKKVAELWYRVGWRDHIVSTKEIRCSGCSYHKQCSYGLVECTETEGVEKCNQCKKYPCEKVNDMLQRSAQSQAKCKEVCTKEEYDRLEKSFFHKEENLKK